MRLVFLPFLILTVGCESVSSEDVMTSGLYANIDATSDGEATIVTVILRTGGKTSNTYVELTGDDELTATTGETTQTLAPTSISNVYLYNAGFEETSADAEFQISLVRTLDEGAPNSSATLPAPFEFTAPTPDATFSRADDSIVVTWSEPGDDELWIIVEGDCFWDYQEQVNGSGTDAGTYTVPSGALEAYEEDADSSCDGNIKLQRQRAGTLDAGYGEGGEIFGAQVRQLSFLSEP